MHNASLFHMDIPKRAAICAHGQEAFSPGMEIHSTLQGDQGDGKWIRKDYCQQCWSLLASQTTLEPVRSTWRSKIAAKKAPPTLPKQRDARAMHLLQEALMRHEAEDEAEAFVLALYLARKRLIYFRQDILLEDGCNASIYEIAHTGEMFCVKKFPLSSLHVEQIQCNLAEKFR